MLVQVFDASNFLYAQLRDGAHVSGINTTGLETLLTRLTRYKFNTNIIVLDPLAGDGVRDDVSGYKANRDGKPLEISIMEEFLETFQKELGITVIRAPKGKEADDLIYSIVHHYIYNTKSDIIVYSDDRDIAGCIIDTRVVKHPASSTMPKIDIKNYSSHTVRDAFVPYNLIAGYTIAMGKVSDNIPAEKDGAELLFKMDSMVRQLKSQNQYLYDNASSYTSMCEILSQICAEDPLRLMDLLVKADNACLHLLPLNPADVPTPSNDTHIKERGVFAALKCIGSKLKHPSRNIDEKAYGEMLRFFERFTTNTMSSATSGLVLELDDDMIPEVDLAMLSHKFTPKEE